MAVKTTIRTPMPIRMRAKQFAMFDAMKGLIEAIAEKEQQNYPKKELTEERKAEINQKLRQIKKGDAISVRYYCQYGKQYRILSGSVQSIDPYWKEIRIENRVICLDEIEDLLTG